MQPLWKIVWRFLEKLIGLPRWLIGKEICLPTQEIQETLVQFNPWVGKILWRRAWKLAQVFLPGESHGQSSLMGSSS